tara:strand:- start:460 stop:663 length:204 start_codon:yes stop_codon:yes gene_type:complete
MSKFLEQVEEVKDELDDLIVYLNHSGNSDSLVNKIRKDLDDADPFTKINALLAAQILVSEGVAMHSH